MRIIEIRTSENGGHRNIDSDISIVPDDWAVIPDDMDTPNFPFGEITVEEIKGVMTVTKWTAGTIPQPAPPTHEEINTMVVAKIREKYDINEEFKMINLGIANPEDEQYIAYRNYVQECVDWGNELESKTE